MASREDPETILIVEDSPSSRIMARAMIEGLGLGVVEAECGVDALSLFESQEFGLILLDVGLPDLDGFGVARQIRAHGKGRDVPIIMVTGKDDVESIKQAFAAGATDFAVKPVSWLILGQRLLFVLEAARRQRQILEQREELQETQRLAGIGSWILRSFEPRLETSEGSQEVLDLQGDECGLDVLADRIPESERRGIQAAIEQSLDTGKPVEFKHTWLDSMGEEAVLYTHASALRSGPSGEVEIHGLSQDITVRERAESRVEFLTQHDALTGLKNQQYFRKTFELMLAQQQRTGACHALLLVNLDNFSRINEVHGREVGDAILREIAGRLAHVVRATDLVTPGAPVDATVARIGGDEFTVVVADIKSPTDAARVASRIVDAVRAPLVAVDKEFMLTARIGIAIASEDGNDLGTLMANATAANRHKKRAGGNGFEFYRSEMNEAARVRMGLERDFRQALLRNEIIVYYQPRVDMRSGVVIGAEALARWQHEKLGWIPPEEFVQLGEESGLTVEFGRSIIEAVAEQMRSWRNTGYEPIPISINISPTLLVSEYLIPILQEVMETNGIAPALIEIEITESVLIRQEEDAAVALDKLKALGLTIALDDFGTGYSALTHLRRFPVDVIKIDRSFVEALNETRGRAIVSGVISMAHSMGLRVVAEGVEEIAQRAFLVEEECDEEQGFLVSRPVPADKFEELFWPRGVAPIFVGIDDDDDE